MRRIEPILFVLSIACLSLTACSNGRGSAVAVKQVTNNVQARCAADVVKADDATGVVSAAKASASKLFTVGKADTLRCAGAALYVRESSITAGKEFSITALSEEDMAALPDELVNVTGKAGGYRFLPHGEHFTQCEATVSLPFDTLKIPLGYTTADIHTYFYDERHKRWDVLETDTIDTKRQLAYSRTSHFTDMVNGILKVPESPETGSLTPTFISDYEPINPAAGITFIQTPKPDASGAASMSYSINIPQGVAGLTPSLTLQYSSDGGSGWVGYGFSIPVEKIEIDSRWGAPAFSPVY